MDFQRLVLVAALSFTLFLIWQAWQKDFGPQPVAPVATTAAPAPAASAPATADIPAPATGQAPKPAEPASALGTGQRIQVTTDLIRAQLDTAGGDLRELELLAYPELLDHPEKPTVLMNDAGELFVAQTGLVTQAGSSAPDHHAAFTADQAQYQLQPGQDRVDVRLHWKGANGLAVDKIYTFHRGSYVVDVSYEVRNAGAEPWSGYAYTQFLRSEPPKKSAFFASTYTGGVIHGEEKKYEKVDFKAMREGDLSQDLKGAWAAMIQHYFLGAWIPADGTQRAYSKVLGDNRYLLGLMGQELTVAPGQAVTIANRLYAGPKLQSELDTVAPGLGLTVDYTWLTFIAKPLWWALEWINKLIGNWGWAIIVLTILIKLAFYKLSETSYKSMAHMRQVQPKMQAIKERYEGDREKMNEAMMKLYREEKINPLGGCLPILVQIPVFIALYWMLLETVELRQAPWILWIKDLSAMDPYYVLPAIMGVSMLVQQRLNPTPMDPIQAKVFMILPVVFTVFFIWFPAGLVLYWVVNNLLSIAQQWYITRKVIGT
jgi:YidC/Oxa1 family membrane protein insertase